MGQLSAGILLHRRTPELQVFLAHMGGPYWAHKDAGAWSIPKGLHEPDEAPLHAALRDFAEEVGAPAPAVEYRLIGEFRQSSGKLLTVFAGEGDAHFVSSNLFDLEWPPRSGRIQQFPEMDDAQWFTLDEARAKIVRGQLGVLDAMSHISG